MTNADIDRIWSEIEWRDLCPVHNGFQEALRHRFAYAVRRAALNEASIVAAIHSQYPVTTDFDRGYARAREDATKSIRALATGDKI